MSAMFAANSTADTGFCDQFGLAVAVHFHFTGPGTASHAGIFYSTADPHSFMTFKMCETDENICIHYGSADFRGRAMDRIGKGNGYFIIAFQPIPDQDGAAGRDFVESVGGGCCQMFQRIFAGTGI